MSISDKTPQRAIMHFCFKLDKFPLKTVQMISNAYGNKILVNSGVSILGEGGEPQFDIRRDGKPRKSIHLFLSGSERWKLHYLLIMRVHTYIWAIELFRKS